MANIAIQAEHLTKQYRLGGGLVFNTLRDQIAHAAKAALSGMFAKNYKTETDPRDFVALHDVSFDIYHGEVIGVVGRNGAGKSTLLKILSRITKPTSGRAVIYGRVGSLLEVGTGFHPELSGRENIYLNGAILGMTKQEMDAQFDAIVDFAEIERFLDTPVKRYSSGMQLRLGFAVAAHLTPEILIVDEVLAVGDIAFQRKCLGKMRDVANSGRTVILVSHNMSAIQRLCNRTCVLQGGRLIALGDTGKVVADYLTAGDDDLSSTELAPASLTAVSKQGRMTFTRFSISQNRSTSGQMRNDQPIDVSIAYTLHRQHRGLRVGFDLYDADGNMLFRSFSDDDASQAVDSQEASHYQLNTSIPANLLQAGRYTLFLAATIHMVEWITHNDVSVSCDVQYAGGTNEAYNDGRPGILLPMLSWRLAVDTSILESSCLATNTRHDGN